MTSEYPIQKPSSWLVREKPALQGHMVNILKCAEVEWATIWKKNHNTGSSNTYSQTLASLLKITYTSCHHLW